VGVGGKKAGEGGAELYFQGAKQMAELRCTKGGSAVKVYLDLGGSITHLGGDNWDENECGMRSTTKIKKGASYSGLVRKLDASKRGRKENFHLGELGRTVSAVLLEYRSGG